MECHRPSTALIEGLSQYSEKSLYTLVHGVSSRGQKMSKMTQFYVLTHFHAFCEENLMMSFIQTVVIIYSSTDAMYFGAELWSGSKNLTDDTFYFWVYLIFFNFLWVIFPLLLLWQSWNATKDVYKRAERNKRE